MGEAPRPVERMRDKPSARNAENHVSRARDERKPYCYGSSEVLFSEDPPGYLVQISDPAPTCRRLFPTRFEKLRDCRLEESALKRGREKADGDRDATPRNDMRLALLNCTLSVVDDAFSRKTGASSLIPQSPCVITAGGSASERTRYHERSHRRAGQSKRASIIRNVEREREGERERKRAGDCALRPQLYIFHLSVINLRSPPLLLLIACVIVTKSLARSFRNRDARSLCEPR